MKHGYTFNILLKYLYKETSILKSLEIENAINGDIELKGKYARILQGFKCLPKVKFYPADKSIANILNYSSNMQLSPGY